MIFEDAVGKVIAKYENVATGGAYRKINLEENEELIGIYGSYNSNYNNWFSRFGFIVKVK